MINCWWQFSPLWRGDAAGCSWPCSLRGSSSLHHWKTLTPRHRRLTSTPNETSPIREHLASKPRLPSYSGEHPQTRHDLLVNWTQRQRFGSAWHPGRALSFTQHNGSTAAFWGRTCQHGAGWHRPLQLVSVTLSPFSLQRLLFTWFPGNLLWGRRRAGGATVSPKAFGPQIYGCPQPLWASPLQGSLHWP